MWIWWSATQKASLLQEAIEGFENGGAKVGHGSGGMSLLRAV